MLFRSEPEEDDDDLDAAFDSYTQAVEAENSYAEQYTESSQYEPVSDPAMIQHGDFDPTAPAVVDEHGNLKDEDFDDGLSTEDLDVTGGQYDDLPEQDLVSDEELAAITEQTRAEQTPAPQPASLRTAAPVQTQDVVPHTAAVTMQSAAVPPARALPAQPIPLAVPHRQKYEPYSVPVDLLQTYPDGEYWVIDEKTQENAEALKSVLREFKIAAEVTGIRKGPVITMFELLPAFEFSAYLIISSLVHPLARSSSP